MKFLLITISALAAVATAHDSVASSPISSFAEQAGIAINKGEEMKVYPQFIKKKDSDDEDDKKASSEDDEDSDDEDSKDEKKEVVNRFKGICKDPNEDEKYWCDIICAHEAATVCDCLGCPGTSEDNFLRGSKGEEDGQIAGPCMPAPPLPAP